MTLKKITRALLVVGALVILLALAHLSLRPAPVLAPTASTATVTATAIAVSPTASLTPTATLLPPTPSVTPTQSPSPTPSPTGTPSPTPTAVTLLMPALPTPGVRDPVALALALRGAKPEPSPAPVAYKVGDRARFWLANLDDVGEVFTITATLEYVSPHLYMWVEDGANADLAGLASSAQTFEDKIYPTNRRYFGPEPSPGVDGDAHLTVLNAVFTGAAGYYSSADAYPRWVNPYSNQRDMFYLNLQYKEPGTDSYNDTLVHEFQHMIEWNADRNEDAWVNEGMSQMAEVLNGFPPDPVTGFEQDPDVQLTSFGSGADYDAALLWTSYFAQRLGDDALRSVVQATENGVAGYNKALSELGSPLRFQDLFTDWVVANYLDDETIADGQYGFTRLDPRGLAAQAVRAWPYETTSSVHQFAADYYELYPAGKALQIDFTGAPTVPLVPTLPFSGRYFWWSNRGDNSDTTLAHEFDLTTVSSATLQYELWYDLEESWDHAYLEVSTDGGQTWQILSTPHTTEDNPYGESYGPAYTGTSGGWVKEETDLSAYAGQRIWVRFQMITDDAINSPGLCLDDIRVPEIGYFDDAESDQGGWVASGFARTDNILPQRFLAQLVSIGAQTEVQQLALDGENRGVWQIGGADQGITRAVLIISGVTPYTTEMAGYTLRVAAP